MWWRSCTPAVLWPCALGSLAVMAGCSHPPSQQPPATASTAASVPQASAPVQQADWVGTWRLQQVGGTQAAALGLGDARVHFAVDRRMHGTTGCNQFFGAYTHTAPDGLEPGTLGMTLMACPMNEHALMAPLQATRHYRVDAASAGQRAMLTLLDAQHQVLSVWVQAH